MDKVKLFDKISPLIFEYLKRLVFYIVHDEELAKDVLQDTLIKVWKHIDQLHDEEKLRAWAKTIATRTAIKAINKKRKLRERIFSVQTEDLDYMHGTDSAEDIAIQRMEVRDAMEFIGNLDEKTRRIFVLHGEYDMTFQEIGKCMGISPETAKTRYYRTLDRYRKNKGR